MKALRYWLIAFCSLISSFNFNCPLYSDVEAVLKTITMRACETNSTALLVARNGNFISFDGNQFEPVDARSVTKSFVGLAIGMMLQDGLITTVDTPVYYFFPEWNQGCKKTITLRHLLNHTSGIETETNIAEIYQFPDAVRMALAADFASPPDTRFIYNNVALNLLAGVVEKATGISIHAYLKKGLFEPLCINSDSWLCDTAGNNYGMSHLSISALDLAKVGMLLANGGCWNGRQLISSEWIEYMQQPTQSFTPFYGSLWWLGYYSMNLYWDSELLDQYDAAGIPCEYILALQNLQGRVLVFEGHICYGNFLQQCVPQLSPYFGSCNAVYDFFAQIEKKGLPIGRWETGQLKSFSARGYLGQQLIIFPEEKIVAVRLSNASPNTCGYNDTFSEMESWIALLIYEMNCYNASIDYYYPAYQ